LLLNLRAPVKPRVQSPEYYGSVNVTASNAANGVQVASVLLNVVAAGQTGAGASFGTGGLLLSGAAGSKPQQQVSLFNPSATAANFTSSVFTANGGGWLTVSPASGALTPGANALTIQADLTGLASGVQTGSVRVVFDDGSFGTIQVAAIVKAGGSSSARPLSRVSQPFAAPACTGGKPGYLVAILMQPFDQSALQVAVPHVVQAQIVDDCGNPVTAQNGGLAQALFSDGDAAIDLHDIGGGTWQGTWTPVAASSQVTLQLAATEQALALDPTVPGSSVMVAVRAAGSAAAGQPTGVVNAASAAQATPGVVSPGSYVAIYGTGLAGNGAPSATSLPLPSTLNGTQLLLGGQPLPLLYASATQVNALIPQALAPNASYQLVVVRGTTQSAPVPLTVAELQPGIYTVNLSGSGQGIVEIAGTTLLAAPAGTGTRPVQSGSEYLVVFCTGLGAVAGPNGEAGPTDGAAAPLNLVLQTAATVTATIGGVNAPVVFSGLTPGLAGLYQVNVQVPAGTPTGDAVPLVLTVTEPTTGTTAQSNQVTVAVQ